MTVMVSTSFFHNCLPLQLVLLPLLFPQLSTLQLRSLALLFSHIPTITVMSTASSFSTTVYYYMVTASSFPTVRPSTIPVRVIASSFPTTVYHYSLGHCLFFSQLSSGTVRGHCLFFSHNCPLFQLGLLFLLFTNIYPSWGHCLFTTDYPS